jgi:uncharacterized RDD family membrane protein YckC
MTNLPVVSKARRAIATLIDLVVIILILAPLFAVQHFLGIKIIGEAWILGNPTADPELAGKIMGFTWYFFVGCLVVVWLYFVQMETSRYRGTLGKLVTGLQVVNFAGEQISSMRSSVRFILSGLRVLLIYLTLVEVGGGAALLLGDQMWFDMWIVVVCGGAFVLILFHAGNRGQRLQDFFSRTRVTRRDWCPDTAEPNAILAKVSASNKVFKIVSRLLWVALFLGSALWVFYQGKTDSQQPPPPIQTNAPPAAE